MQHNQPDEEFSVLCPPRRCRAVDSSRISAEAQLRLRGYPTRSSSMRAGTFSGSFRINSCVETVTGDIPGTLV